MTLQTIIDAAWDDRANLGLETKGEIRDAVESALAQVAARVDALATANRAAAETVDLADDTYAARIRATLNSEP